MDTRYMDVIQVVQQKISKAGISLTEPDIYACVVEWESQVWGKEDYENGAIWARLRKRTKTVFTAIPTPWVGPPRIDNPVTDSTTPLLYDTRGTVLIPATQDLQRGIWHFITDQTAVFIAGIYVDVNGAAVEALDRVLSGEIDQVTVTDQSGTVNLDQIYQHLERVRDRLAGKIRPYG